MQTFEICLNRLLKQANFEKFQSYFMKKIEWPMLYVFLLKPFKQWNLEKLQITLMAKFLHKKLSVFIGSYSFLSFP